MKNCIEFYKMGISLAPFLTKEVKSQDMSNIDVPVGAYMFRFFEVDDSGHKQNFSEYYYIGREISIEDFKKKYPQVDSVDFNGYDKILITPDSHFYPLKENEKVIGLIPV